jgi:membrane associated rhomboid family serine protease
MGIYDRDYYRQEQRTIAWGGPQSVVVFLVVLNAAVFVGDYLFSPEGQPHYVIRAMELHVGDLARPLMWWHFLSYAFAHQNFSHIVFNMLGLWFLGRAVEEFYGRREFLCIYLALAVLSGVCWALVGRLAHDPRGAVLGASGPVVGIVILFAANFPRMTVTLIPIPIPIPAWVLGVIVVGSDVYRAIANTQSQVAYTVHLSAAALAGAYFYSGWNFGRLGTWFSWKWPRPRTRLHIHRPNEESEMNDEVDRILQKISLEGEASLTRKERRTLEDASRQYQRRRQRSGDR